MIGVFSDVHANREALSEVLEALLGLNPDKLICLGDIVGYGPDPEWCVDAVQGACDVVLCGNHDSALIYGASEFSAAAEWALNYHRGLLMPRTDPPGSVPQRQRRWEFLKGLPARYAEDELLFVHGSPRNPTSEYLREADVRLGLIRKLTENFELLNWLGFVGHTHRPGVITGEFMFLKPEDLGDVYRAEPGKKAIINVGSVGQPRDGDPRATFVTIEGPEVRYHRVPYDVEKTVRKIEDSGGLDPEMAERLRTGT